MSASVENEQGLRDQAEESLKKKSEFRAHLFAYVLVNTFLVGIWVATGAGFFWPAFPIGGWGIGLAFHAWDVYRRAAAVRRADPAGDGSAGEAALALASPRSRADRFAVRPRLLSRPHTATGPCLIRDGTPQVPPVEGHPAGVTAAACGERGPWR